MSKSQPVNRAKTDPQVSCPIVCGEYMRATGFFFQGNEETYLVTARHNVLPTNGDELKTNKVHLPMDTDDFLPAVDIYLDTQSGFELKRIDLRKRTGVKQTPEIDIIGIPLDFAPERYGYQVWTSDDVITPTSASETLETIGFNGSCFLSSNCDYSAETYRKGIENPAVLRLVNEMPDDPDTSRYGLIAMAIDEKAVGAYNGLSGAPVLGNGIVGIHTADQPVPDAVYQQTSSDEFRLLIYWRAEILPILFE